MSLEFTYEGSAFAGTVKPSTVQLPERAEMGDTGNGLIPLEDAAGSVGVVGYRPFIVEESECSQPRLFTGWTVERGYGRDVAAGLLVEEQRLTEVNIVSTSAAASFRLISGDDGNRPAETWNDRLAWIVGSDYLDGLIGGDTTFFGSYTQMMDAADYRDGNAGHVFEDLCERTGGVLNWFFFWNPDTSAIELFIKREQYTIEQCTLSISNALSDVDGVTVFEPDNVAKLAREPDQVYSEVVVQFNGGRVFRSRPATEAAYIRRGTSISRPYTKSATTAQSQAEAWLDAHAEERDRITCTMRSVPASLVGLVRAGMGMNVRFTHMPGYEAFVGVRIVMCAPVPVDDAGMLYDIALELVRDRPVTQGLQQGKCWEENNQYDLWVGFDNPPTPGNLLVMVGYGWGGTGVGGIGEDAALIPAGWTVDVSMSNDNDNLDVAKLYAYLAHRVAQPGDPAAWLSASNADTTSERWFDIFEFAGYDEPTATDTGRLAVNGSYGPLELSPTGSGGMIFGLFAQHAGGHGTPFGYCPNPSGPYSVDFIPAGTTIDYVGCSCYPSRAMVLAGWTETAPVSATRNWHDYEAMGMAAFYPALGPPGGGSDVEVDLGNLPGEVHTDTSDPTVDDDSDAGYVVGQVWINTATPEAFILTDATPGAAVWVSLTAGGSAVEVLDEGSSLTAALTSLDFVGAGVTATNSGGDVTVTIPGGSGSLAWFNVVDYGAVGDGSTDDADAIDDAIAAMVTAGGGVLYFPATADSYLTTGGHVVSVPAMVRGDGPASKITLDSTTATLFSVTTPVYDPVDFADLVLLGSHSASAGSAIEVTTNGQSAVYANVLIDGFYIQIDMVDGAAWSIRDCGFRDPVLYGIRINNATNADWGDSTITGCYFEAISYDADAAIRWESSGGLRIVNNKINGTAPYGFDVGIDLYPTGTTGSPMIEACSIENYHEDGVRYDDSVAGGDADRLIVTNCQFGQYNGNTTGHAVYVDGANDVIVSDCSLTASPGAPYAISLNNGSGALIGPFTNTGFGAILETSSYTAIDDRTAGYIGAKVTRTSTQSIPDDTDTAVAFTSELWDPQGMHDNSTNNSRITVPTAGKWLITGSVAFDGSATWGQRTVWIGYTTGGPGSHMSVDQDTLVILTVTDILDLDVGDYVELYVHQISGGALNLLYWGGTPSLSATLLR